MNEHSDKIKGIIGTVVGHLVILLAFFLMALKTPLPLPGEEGVEVDLGYADQGMGLIQPDEMVVPEELQSQAQPAEPQPEEEVLTQEVEETPVSRPRTDEPKETVEQEITEKKQKETDQIPDKPEPKVNPDALYKGPGKGNAASGGQGVNGTPGDQGRPDGTKNAGNYEGSGGSGSGISYDLSGRKARNLPKPDYTSDEQGRIVVTIWVNRAGSVVKAEPGARGTTIADLTLRTQARNAALKASFSPSPDAPELQTGTITYVFIKMN
jgi:outer membrane biosynthesis protein TonB